ncbi:DUF4334 domain-containing protein [Citreimonas salinaria]|uniref:DUF4334 domain-containing protein n=1 Tax=Citreimonas salinaria TaxID=321339 RepID=A0A1H3F9Z6_9RHOB|nr:DUF4334 domain-containing protein [Citreimonas salinaria]SDX87168.1 protein of unknown function [Citreimonas salinaria]
MKSTGRALARVELRGCLESPMAYDRQPIVHHFRRIESDRALGLTQVRAMAP